MNKFILMGRLTKDPEVKAVGDTTNSTFTIAVDRKVKKDAEKKADFIRCQAWGYTAKFIEQYVKKGTKLIVSGRIQTGDYTNKDGQKVFTTDFIVEEAEFAESKGTSAGADADKEETGFVDVASAVNEELPFR